MAGRSAVISRFCDPRGENGPPAAAETGQRAFWAAWPAGGEVPVNGMSSTKRRARTPGTAQPEGAGGPRRGAVARGRQPARVPEPLGNRIRDTCLSQLLKDLHIAAVPHRFRSSFRDWAAEETDTAGRWSRRRWRPDSGRPYRPGCRSAGPRHPQGRSAIVRRRRRVETAAVTRRWKRAVRSVRRSDRRLASRPGSSRRATVPVRPRRDRDRPRSSATSSMTGSRAARNSRSAMAATAAPGTAQPAGAAPDASP